MRSLRAVASVMAFRALLGIMTVAAVIISIEHLATTVTLVFDQYANGLYFSLATFGFVPVAAITALYLLFRPTPVRKSNVSETLAVNPFEIAELALNFYGGFTEGISRTPSKSSPC